MARLICPRPAPLNVTSFFAMPCALPFGGLLAAPALGSLLMHTPEHTQQLRGLIGFLLEYGEFS
ncbi:MAG: hypothetical protein ACOYLI_04185 [Synechococcus lacustris]